MSSEKVPSESLGNVQLRDHVVTSFGTLQNISNAEWQKEFNTLCDNRLGKILKESDLDTLNCMKFAHYLPVYEEVFRGLENSSVEMLEIGVQHGGSFRLWQKFFGRDNFKWTGIDIDPRCLALNSHMDGSDGKVIIGSQDDAAFLKMVMKERGMFDIVIDDGSHCSDDIISAFQVLSPNIRDGGFYIIEDTHACYWNGFRGKGEFVNAVSYFQGIVHALNNLALDNVRCSEDISDEERILIPAPIRRIDFHQSMIVCHMGVVSSLLMWSAGAKTVINHD